jgi:hypothetical protein
VSPDVSALTKKFLDGLRVAARGAPLWDADGGYLISVGRGQDAIVVTARRDRLLPKHLRSEFEGTRVQWVFVTSSIQLLSD